MLDDLLFSVMSLLIIVVAIAARPTRAQCPRGFYLDAGIRTSGPDVGAFSCRRPPIGGDDDVLTGRETAIEQPGVLRSRIYCTGGTMPVVVNHRTVGCQRGGWR